MTIPSLRGGQRWSKLRSMLLRLWPHSILILLSALLFGCESPKGTDVDEQKNSHFIEGKERTKARDYQGAIEAFQRAVDGNPNSALAHFELGMLYEEHDERNEWRYVLALYHYYRAYELRPNAYPGDNAKLRIQACRQELAKTESLAPLYPSMQRELEKLREDNSQLRRRVDFLQTQVAVPAATVPTNSSPSFSAPPNNEVLVEGGRSNTRMASSQERSANPATTGVRKHTVKDRETFASIARLYRLRIDSILAANPSIEPKRLRAGQTVNIP